jgi:hypothetical protein
MFFKVTQSQSDETSGLAHAKIFGDYIPVTTFVVFIVPFQ